MHLVRVICSQCGTGGYVEDGRYLRCNNYRHCDQVITPADIELEPGEALVLAEDSFGTLVVHYETA